MQLHWVILVKAAHSRNFSFTRAATLPECSTSRKNQDKFPFANCKGNTRCACERIGERTLLNFPFVHLREWSLNRKMLMQNWTNLLQITIRAWPSVAQNSNEHYAMVEAISWIYVMMACKCSQRKKQNRFSISSKLHAIKQTLAKLCSEQAGGQRNLHDDKT